MQLLRHTACVGLLLLAQNAMGESDVSMPADLAYGYGSSQSESMQLQLKLTPALRVENEQRTALIASARVRLDPEDRLEPGEAPTDNYAPLSKPLTLGDAGVTEIRDLYVEGRVGKGLYRIGKQQIVWGRLDGIKVLDLLNPQDFREFVMEDFGESRISLWSAYLDVNIGSWRTELAVIPDGTGHVIPEPGAWFELSAPRFRFGADPDQPAPPIVAENPRHGIDSTAIGGRLSGQLGPLDVGLVAYSGLDPEPLGRLAIVDSAVVVERFNERRNALGFSAESGAGRSVFRVEYAYQPDRHFNTRTESTLDVAELDQHRVALGLDVDGPASIFLNLQFLVDLVDGAPTELVRPARDRIGTLFARKSFGYDKLVLEARWFHSFSDGDDHVSASIGWSVGSNSLIRLSADAFTGTPAGLFGQFAERDRIVLGIEHVF